MKVPERDLIIGGLGSDYMKAGAGEDLVIAGTTDYDADVAALAAIREEEGSQL